MKLKGKWRHCLVMLVCVSLLLLCSVTALPQSALAVGQTYYVDQTAGNDNNNGTSPSTPWKNCPGMVAYTGSGTLSPGDTVYFDKADTWTSSQWAPGLMTTGGITYIGNSWGGAGSRATIKATGSTQALIEFYHDNATYPTVVNGFNLDGNHNWCCGVGFYYPSYNVGVPLNGATKRVENCDVHDTWSDVSQGQYAYGIIASDDGGYSSRVENVEILNNTVHDTSRDGICLYPTDRDQNCIVKNALVRGNTVYNTGQDPNYGAGSCLLVKGHVIDSTFEYNYVYNSNASGIFMNSNEHNHYGTGIENLTIRYNIVGSGHRYGSIRIYDNSSGSDPKDIKIYGNIVYGNSVPGFWLATDLLDTNALRVYNNTFYNAPVDINTPNATYSPFEFKNNIVYDDDGRTSLTGSSYFTSSSNNLTTDPSFKNTSNLPTGFTGTYGTDMAPNNDGLNIQSGSNARDTGTALGSPYNSSINTVSRPYGSAWDIGAYEYTGGGPTNTPGPTPTPTPTPAATPTPTPTPAATPTPTPTPAATSTPTPVPGGWTRVEDSSAGISWNGAGWTTYSDANCSGGSIKRTANGAEYADFTFTGTGVRWYDTRDTNRGISKVYIDSVQQTSIDEYGSTQYQTKMYEKTGLTNGSHTLRVMSGTTKNASSSGYACGVDCFEYTGSTGPTPTPTPTSTPTPTPTPTSTPTPTPTPAPTSTPTPTPGGWTRVEENGSGISWNGAGWTTYSDASCSGGALKRTGNGMEYVDFTFTGTGVRWYDKRDTNRGITNVYVDSVLQTSVDGYGSAQYVYKMYEKTGLSNAQHTLRLMTTGTKNASSSGTLCGVDCFEYKTN